jgi:archaellum biogenesis ATPase FlaH
MNSETNRPELGAKIPITAETIMAHANELSEKALKAAQEHVGLFIVKPAHNWVTEASKKPIPNMLFDRFWYEGELCILFADTNLGKSILAVQIANSIAEGINIPGLMLQSPAQQVVYFDFEMSAKQFENRYSADYKDHYSFHSYFLRAEMNPDAIIAEDLTLEDYLIRSLEVLIRTKKANVLVIDNLTYLRAENEKASDALPLMKHLKTLKTRYDLSILVLAHTPKRDAAMPITRNDLQGSKMLINFCDSAFAIGESNIDKSLRYLKQIKQRNTEPVYDADNVCVCTINKPHNFLKFELERYDTEAAHLRQQEDANREELEQKVMELHKQGKSLRQIADELGIYHSKVNRILKANE